MNAVPTIRELLRQSAGLVVDAAKLDDDDDLHAAGLTSHGTVTLVLACEDAYGIEFPTSAMRRSTFATIATLTAALVGLGVPATAIAPDPADETR